MSLAGGPALSLSQKSRYLNKGVLTMTLVSTIKRNSRLALNGNWGRAILCLMIGFGILLLLGVMQTVCIRVFVLPQVQSNPTMTPYEFWGAEGLFWYSIQIAAVETCILGAFSLLTMLLTAPVGLGTAHWYYALVGGEAPPLGEVFRFFESFRDYRRALWYYIQFSARAFLWAVLFFLLPFALGTASVMFLQSAEGSRLRTSAATIGILFLCALTLLACILYCIFLFRYALVPYLLCGEGGDKLRVRDAFRLSVRYTKGYRSGLFLFSLSFIGWLLLIPFTFGLIFLYLGPYYNTAIAMYARYIIEKNRIEPPNATKEFVVGNEPAPVSGPFEPFAGPAPAAPPPKSEDTPPAEAPESIPPTDRDYE